MSARPLTGDDYRWRDYDRSVDRERLEEHRRFRELTEAELLLSAKAAAPVKAPEDDEIPFNFP